MRNGNFDLLLSNGDEYNVLILPMRNGNKVESETHQSLSFMSLSYLWGMETWRRFKSYGAWYLVLILPMRNGNQIYRLWRLLIFFDSLSYLWGLETHLGILNVKKRIICPYPTYEEWKREIITFLSSSYIRPYPTYEEWKPNHPKNHSGLSICPYPTYEEWKQTASSKRNVWWRRSLSYLWGMETIQF